MSHTKEPWSIDEYGRVKADGCNEFLGVQVDGFSLNGGEESKANARRIVACINACAGKKTEALEAMAGKDIFTGNIFSKRVEMEKERDTYRDLCAELIQTLRHIQGAALDIDVGRATIALGAKKAITKAEAILGEKNGNAN